MLGKSKARVLVAGAGPVGLLTALHLERNGIQTRIVDRAWRSGQRSYGAGLHWQSQELLDEIGFLNALDGHPIDSLEFYDGNEPAASVNLSTQTAPYPGILVVSQSRLEEALARQLEKEFHRKVDWNHQVAGAVQGDDAVTVTIDTLGRESTGYATSEMGSVLEKTVEQKYELVIGADGCNSQVRRALGAEWTQAGDSETYAIFELIARPNSVDSKLRIAFHGAHASILWPLGGGRWRWAFQIDSLDRPDAREKARLSVEIDELVLEKARTLFGELVAERAPWFADWSDDLVWSGQIRFERRLAEPFGDHRIWLAGDAAHLTSPLGIQSMNRGLQEAMELGWRVPRFLEQRRADLMKEYKETEPRIWRGLLGLGGPLAADPSTPDWAARQAERLRSIPATGKTLRQLLGSLGLTQGSPAAR